MTQAEVEELVPGTILVYLCNGDVKVFREGDRVVVEGDKLVCFDEQGCEMARFSARDVYMCTRRPVPRAVF
ncbi:MAG TPA: hypothetical protein VH951_14065 [Dehalococcoidia bacterium]|jgi:hypothetical protein